MLASIWVHQAHICYNACFFTIQFRFRSPEDDASWRCNTFDGSMPYASPARKNMRLFTLSRAVSSYLALLLHDVGRPCSVSWHHDKVKDTRSGISRLSLVLKYVIGVSRPSNLLSIVVLHARSVRKIFCNLENMCWHSLIVTSVLTKRLRNCL